MTPGRTSPPRSRLELRESTPVHDGATARLRATTPLGELFVQIDDAESGRRLRDGATLGVDSTSAAPTIEDTMTSASLLLNGGGLGQLETIVREANLVLDGNEGTARDLLGRMARTAEAFNESNEDIDATLDALADLSTTLNRRSDTINAALEDIAPAARVLRKNTDELVDLLQSIERLRRRHDRGHRGHPRRPAGDAAQVRPGVRRAELARRRARARHRHAGAASPGSSIEACPPTTSTPTCTSSSTGRSPACSSFRSRPGRRRPTRTGTGGLAGHPARPARPAEPPQPSTEKPGLLGGLLGLFGGDR